MERIIQLKRDLLESLLYFYIDQYKLKVKEYEKSINMYNQCMNENNKLADNIYYEFCVKDPFCIENIHLLQKKDYDLNGKYKYCLGNNIIIYYKNSDYLIVHIEANSF